MCSKGSQPAHTFASHSGFQHHINALDGSCSGDVDLRLQVELLLAKEQQAGSFLEAPAIEDTTLALTTVESLLGTLELFNDVRQEWT